MVNYDIDLGTILIAGAIIILVVYVIGYLSAVQSGNDSPSFQDIGNAILSGIFPALGGPGGV
jgi:hypothetical protein